MWHNRLYLDLCSIIASFKKGCTVKAPVETYFFLSDERRQVCPCASMTQVVPFSPGPSMLHAQRPPSRPDGHGSRRSIFATALCLQRLTWCFTGLMIIHAGCGVFLICYGATHKFLDDPDMDYFAGLLASASVRRFAFWGHVFMLMGVAHILEMTSIVIDWRRFSMLSRLAAEHSPSRSRRYQCRATKRLSLHAQLVLEALFGRTGIFGVEGAHFNALFLGRELIEIASQCFQAYRFSMLISRPWINNLYVMALIANCWSTPIFQRRFSAEPSRERIACLLCDGMLSIVVSILIPLAIFFPYIIAFDHVNLEFPMEMQYNDAQFASFVMENQSLFVLSTTDGLSKLIPHVSIYVCFRGIRGLLRVAHNAPENSVRVVVPRQVARPHLESSSHWTPEKRPGSISKQTRFLRLAHVVFVIIGAVVLALHCRAATIESTEPADEGCKQLMRSWFHTKPACSIYEFNCFRMNTSTVDDECAFSRLDESSLRILILAHCPALLIPTCIRRFPRLLGFELWNSTIVDWNRQSAFDPVTQKELLYVTMAFVNMSSLPPGLMVGLPHLLSDIEISMSNLTHLPPNIDEMWPGVTLIYIENSAIEEVPDALFRMPLSDLSLIGNKLESLGNVTMNQRAFSLSLSGNPLVVLPEKVGMDFEIGLLYLEDTAVDTLPSWVSDRVQIATYSSGSPLCGDEKISDLATGAVCEPQPCRRGQYPVDYMVSLRQT